MARQGRTLEELVKLLEEIFSNDPNIKVTSPDYVKGTNSNTLREIDVSIRAKVGSVEILIMLECRDRNKRQDVNWIEQIAKKKEDVQASEAIAISTKGFSKSAITMAKTYGIELRTMDELSLDAVSLWFFKGFQTLKRELVDISLGGNEALCKYIKNLPQETIIQLIDCHGNLISTHTIWDTALNSNPHLEQNLIPGIAKNVTIHLNCRDPNHRYSVKGTDNNYPVTEITLKGILRLDHLSPIKVNQYSTINMPLAQTVQYETPDKNLEITFIRPTKEETSII